MANVNLAPSAQRIVNAVRSAGINVVEHGASITSIAASDVAAVRALFPTQPHYLKFLDRNMRVTEKWVGSNRHCLIVHKAGQTVSPRALTESVDLRKRTYPGAMDQATDRHFGRTSASGSVTTDTLPPFTKATLIRMDFNGYKSNHALELEQRWLGDFVVGQGANVLNPTKIPGVAYIGPGYTAGETNAVYGVNNYPVSNTTPGTMTFSRIEITQADLSFAWAQPSGNVMDNSALASSVWDASGARVVGWKSFGDYVGYANVNVTNRVDFLQADRVMLTGPFLVSYAEFYQGANDVVYAANKRVNRGKVGDGFAISWLTNTDLADALTLVKANLPANEAVKLQLEIDKLTAAPDGGLGCVHFGAVDPFTTDGRIQPFVKHITDANADKLGFVPSAVRAKASAGWVAVSAGGTLSKEELIEIYADFPRSVAVRQYDGGARLMFIPGDMALSGLLLPDDPAVLFTCSMSEKLRVAGELGAAGITLVDGGHIDKSTQMGATLVQGTSDYPFMGADVRDFPAMLAANTSGVVPSAVAVTVAANGEGLFKVAPLALATLLSAEEASNKKGHPGFAFCMPGFMDQQFGA